MFTICSQQNRIGRRICLDEAFLFVNFLPRALLNEAILSSPPLTLHASAFSTVKPCVFCLSCHFALSLPTTTVQLRIRGIYIHGENLHACKPSQPRLYRIEKRIDANGRFLDGVGYRYVCRYVDVGQSLRSSDCLGNRY